MKLYFELKDEKSNNNICYWEESWLSKNSWLMYNVQYLTRSSRWKNKLQIQHHIRSGILDWLILENYAWTYPFVIGSDHAKLSSHILVIHFIPVERQQWKKWIWRSYEPENIGFKLMVAMTLSETSISFFSFKYSPW